MEGRGIRDTISSFLIEKYIQIDENIWEIRVFLLFEFDMNKDLATITSSECIHRRDKVYIFLRK